MSLKKYRLPNGVLYVNTDGSMIRHIIDNGIPVEILPGKAYLAGNMRGIPMEEYFSCPEIWDAKWEIYQAIQKRGKTVVAIDARRVKKFGDQLMLTVLPKAYREAWGTKAKVDVMISEGCEEIWMHNPHVNAVITKLDKNKKYDKVVDVAGLGLKFRRPEEANCTDAILNGMGLALTNKTPVYTITEEEKKWAKEELKRDKKRGLPTGKGLIGISLFSAVKSRTYPYMMKVARELGDKGYGLALLDHKNKDGDYRWTFRQMAALMNLCDLVLTADSALLHLAGALKKKIVGLFAYTEGHIYTESYEKAFPIQAPCPYGKKPCWWEIECIPGPNDHLAKTNLDHAHCLKELEPDTVVDAVEEQFTKPRNLLLVVLTYDCLDMTKRAIDSIRAYHNYDLFVVDNKSKDGTQEWLREQGIEFVSKKTSVAAAQNIGIEKFKKGNYDYLIFLNNDIALRYDMLDKLVECAEHSGAYGVMGTQRPFSWNVDSAKPEDNEWTEIVDIPAGSYSATLFTKGCIEKIGLFNGRFTPRYIEDNDYTIRIRASGGKFVQAHGALFWHHLGAVIKMVEKAPSADKTKYWDDNIGVFQELYGISPHEPQCLEKLGLEWKKDEVVKKLDRIVGNNNKKIRIQRRMGGYGDILFTSVIARELKRKYGDKIIVEYAVPEDFFCVLGNNLNIDLLTPCVAQPALNLCVDITDLEFRVELQEMQKYGMIKSARTEIYLDILGLDKSNLKPDYFVTEEEQVWAEERWDELEKAEKKKSRIVVVSEGSNKLKIWPKMQELVTTLQVEGYEIIQIDKKGKAKWSFRKAAALVATAKLVISPDSGISNLAGALDIPAVTIFSNRNGKNFAKMFRSMIPIQGDCPYKEEDYCDFFCPCLGEGPHRAKENIKIPDCLKRLEVETVCKVVRKILGD